MMDFSEHREEVRRKYISCVLKTSRSERHVCRERFRTHDSVLKLLASTKLSDRLHSAIVQVMDDLKEDWQPEEVAAAFDAMETYAMNLLEYPWKKEFHTILLYSGFYKTRLEPNLQEPHLLLKIIGYEQIQDNRLFLVNGVPSQAVLTDAAIDFFLAATECRVIASVVSKVEHSTPVEVYWMRRANIGDERVCVDTLTLSRRPLPLESENPLTIESGETDRHSKKFVVDPGKRGDSPYDNLMLTGEDSKPEYGFLAQPFPTQSASLLTEAQLSEPYLPAFRQQPTPTGQAMKLPSPSARSVLQSRLPEAPPPVYSEAKDMPSAQLQNISYSQNDEVDALAALLKNVDPHVMEDAAHRQQIMTRLGNYSSAGSGSGKPDIPARHLPAKPPDSGGVEAGWQCKKCTYCNESSSRVCDMCQSQNV